LRSPVYWLIRSGDAGRIKKQAEPTWTAASFPLVVGGPAGLSLMFGLLSLCR